MTLQELEALAARWAAAREAVSSGSAAEMQNNTRALALVRDEQIQSLIKQEIARLSVLAAPALAELDEVRGLLPRGADSPKQCSETSRWAMVYADGQLLDEFVAGGWQQLHCCNECCWSSPLLPAPGAAFDPDERYKCDDDY